MQLQVGRFFSSIIRSEPKAPKFSLPKNNESEFKALLVTAIGETCIKNNLDLYKYQSIIAAYNKDENRIEIQIRF